MSDVGRRRSSAEVNQDESEMVRAAMAFALYKKGHVTYLGRLIDFAGSDMPGAAAPGVLRGARAVGDPPVALVRLQEPDADVRRNLVTVLGGARRPDDGHCADAATKRIRNRDVATAATSAIERIKMTSAVSLQSP